MLSLKRRFPRSFMPSCTIEDFWATNVRRFLFRNSADRKENPPSNPDRFRYMSCHKAPIDRHIYTVMAKVQTLIKIHSKNLFVTTMPVGRYSIITAQCVQSNLAGAASSLKPGKWLSTTAIQLLLQTFQPDLFVQSNKLPILQSQPCLPML